MDDSVRIAMLKELEKRDLTSRILFSMDITRKSNMEYKGGIGYCYLFDVFFKNLLAAGFSQSLLERILKDNPRRYFTGA